LFKTNNIYSFSLLKGGDGNDGLKGRDALKSEVDCNYSKQSHNYWMCNPNNGKTEIWDRYMHQEKGADRRIKVFTLGNQGECGTNGKNPGKGGIGGLSGYSGVFIHKINSISHRIHDNSKIRLGKNGSHGSHGLGGYRGDSYQRVYYIREIPTYAKALSFGFAALGNRYSFLEESEKEFEINGNKFSPPWDRSIPSQDRCHTNYYNPNEIEKNSKSQIQPQNSQIDLFSHETQYLKFISNLELKESKLHERDFFKLLLKGNNTL
jgi:hypothetical protein